MIIIMNMFIYSSSLHKYRYLVYLKILSLILILIRKLSQCIGIKIYIFGQVMKMMLMLPTFILVFMWMVLGHLKCYLTKLTIGTIKIGHLKMMLIVHFGINLV